MTTIAPTAHDAWQRIDRGVPVPGPVVRVLHGAVEDVRRRLKAR